MTGLFLALMFVNVAAMIATVAPLWLLLPSLRVSGIARIMFYALVTLKTWVLLVYSWFLFVTFVPVTFARELRPWVYVGLVGYSAAQSVCVAVALYRWRKQANN